MTLSDFGDIRPYTDEEAVEALGRVSRHPMTPVISKYLFPDLPASTMSHMLRGIGSVDQFQNEIMFPIGEPNPYSDYFVGRSFLAPVSTKQIPIYNVTFEPACRNNWHIHHAKSGGGQMLICVGGRGWYQEYGKEARELNPGDIVNIPAEVKHWHGAAKDSWFAHLAVEIQGEDCSTEWCETVSEEDYNKLK